MIEGDGPLGLAGLAVPLVGAVEATEDPFEPYRLVDSAGGPVLPVMAFLADLQACGRGRSDPAVVLDGAAAVVPVPSLHLSRMEALIARSGGRRCSAVSE